MQKLPSKRWVTGWTDQEYHAYQGVGSTDLKYALKSPRHYFHYKNTEKSESTAAQRLGQAVHLLALQPAQGAILIKEKPSIDRRTAAGKKAFEEFSAKLTPHSIVLTEEEFDLAQKIALSLTTNLSVKTLLNQGVAEVAGVLEGGDFIRKIKPDFRSPRNGYLVDIKTALDASPESFARSAASNLYHLQAAYYLDSANEIEALYHEFLWIVVEKNPPFAIAIYVATDEVISAGRELVRKASENVVIAHQAKTVDDIPGYPDIINPLKFPNWSLKND
jgi:hypothetical protein